MLPLDHSELRVGVDEILNRHPAVGLAVGVVRDGSLEHFYGHGFAEVASKTPISEGRPGDMRPARRRAD
jgi:hypothetical protein